MAEKKPKQYVSDNARLMAEWDWSKNDELGLKPDSLTLGSNKKVGWKCAAGHEWQAMIYSRAKGSGCPTCAKATRVVNNVRNQIKKKGSLATNFPDLAKEWDVEKNNFQSATEVLCGSTKKAWWRCAKNHSWEARISHRVAGAGCPICAQITQSSFPELAILYYLRQYTPVEHRYKHNGLEVDVYLPKYNIGIEYDGVYYHQGEKSLQKERKKDKALLLDGITVIRIKETREEKETIDENTIYCVPTTGNTHMNYAIRTLAEFLCQITDLSFYNLDVDVQRDQIAIRDQLLQYEKEHSAYGVKPYLQEEFHPTKNGQLTLMSVSAHSNLKLWWRCKVCGEEWQAYLSNRMRGSGCPKCSVVDRTEKRYKFLLLKNGSLYESSPQLTKEWHPTRNGSLTPKSVTPSSSRKVWWMCINGHEWETAISNRAKGSGCPYCSGQRAISGYNDLGTIRPDLVKEWDFRKNVDIVPAMVLSGSDKKVWWKCNKGHEWQARIADRNKGQGCPVCAKVKRKKK